MIGHTCITLLCTSKFGKARTRSFQTGERFEHMTLQWLRCTAPAFGGTAVVQRPVQQCGGIYLWQKPCLQPLAQHSSCLLMSWGILLAVHLQPPHVVSFIQHWT